MKCFSYSAAVKGAKRSLALDGGATLSNIMQKEKWTYRRNGYRCAAWAAQAGADHRVRTVLSA